MSIKSFKLLNTFNLIFIFLMNTLAVVLPFGGKTTGELSALYPNLFVPTGFTFAIWSVIYILLIMFIVYQWHGKKKDEVIGSIGILFTINAMANGFWLLFWHYEYVIICMVLMLVLLFSLIMMYHRLRINYFQQASIPWQVSIPISVYLGWISVATIANATVVFIDNGITSLGLGADTWATIVLLVAVSIALYLMYAKKDLFFGAVVCWASFGIYSKRIADTVSIDPNIEHISFVSIFVLIIGMILTFVYSFLKRKKSPELS